MDNELVLHSHCDIQELIHTTFYAKESRDVYV